MFGFLKAAIVHPDNPLRTVEEGKRVLLTPTEEDAYRFRAAPEYGIWSNGERLSVDEVYVEVGLQDVRLDTAEAWTRIGQKTVPSGWKDMVDFCKREYGYDYVGAERPLYLRSGVEQSLYFKDQYGVYHCLPTSRFTQRNPLLRRPLFAW